MNKLIVFLILLFPMITFAETTEIFGINENHLSLATIGMVFVILARTTNTKDKK